MKTNAFIRLTWIISLYIQGTLTSNSKMISNFFFSLSGSDTGIFMWFAGSCHGTGISQYQTK